MDPAMEMGAHFVSGSHFFKDWIPASEMSG